MTTHHRITPDDPPEIPDSSTAAAPEPQNQVQSMTTEQCTKLIADELDRAEKKHPQWDGHRHGHSVIEEEYEEFKAAVFADDHEQAFKEVVQLGAMCARYIKNHAPSSVRLHH